MDHVILVVAPGWPASLVSTIQIAPSVVALAQQELALTCVPRMELLACHV